jgi:hypothetical protein
LQLAKSAAADAAPPVMNAASGVEQQVLDGGRFVIFQYCISILVLTFKRPSRIEYIPPGRDGAWQALGYSVVSLFLGWWGIPWGPIWTVTTLVKNLRGGTDVTSEVLAAQVGPGRAARIMAQRRIVPPQTKGMTILRWSLGGAAALLVLMFLLPFLLVAVVGSRGGKSSAPGAAEFRAANNQINSNQGTVSFGNSPQAVAVAGDFSKIMKTLRNAFFEGGKPGGASLSGHEFLTYCELHSNECAIIVHVPELRRFQSSAKDSLAEMAWDTAQGALQKQHALPPGAKLAVGIRGITLYDRVMVGKIVARQPNGATGLESTVTDSRPESSLYPFFQPPALQPFNAASRPRAALKP